MARLLAGIFGGAGSVMSSLSKSITPTAGLGVNEVSSYLIFWTVTFEHPIDDPAHRPPSNPENLLNARLVAFLNQVTHRFLKVRRETGSWIVTPRHFLHRYATGSTTHPADTVFQVDLNTSKVQVSPATRA